MAFDETIFPTTNDVASTTGDGQKLDETYMTLWAQAAGSSHNYTIAGGTLSDSGLDVTVADGQHFIAGYYVDTNGSESTTVSASTNDQYIYLTLTRDGSNNVTGVTVNNTTTYATATAADACLVGKVDAGASTITTSYDLRRSRLWRPWCHVTKSADQSTSTGSATKLNVDTIVVDTDEMGDTSNDRININTPGIYMAIGTTEWDSNSSGQRRTIIYRDGSIIKEDVMTPGSTGIVSVSTQHIQEVTDAEVSAGAYFELYGTQTTGGSLNMLAKGDYDETGLRVIRLGDTWNSVTL